MTAPTEAPAPGPASGRRHTARYAAVAIAVVLALLVVVLATRDPATMKVGRSPLLGKVAPALGSDMVTATGSYDLTESSGRWVVVNFFATWCVPCREEHPELVQFSRRHAVAGDAEVVSVVFDDQADDVAEFFDRNGGDWPVLDDPRGAIALDWGVAGIPESYLVDPDGVVRSKITGGVRADGLDELLALARQADADAGVDR